MQRSAWMRGSCPFPRSPGEGKGWGPGRADPPCSCTALTQPLASVIWMSFLRVVFNEHAASRPVPVADATAICATKPRRISDLRRRNSRWRLPSGTRHAPRRTTVSERSAPYGGDEIAHGARRESAAWKAHGQFVAANDRNLAFAAVVRGTADRHARKQFGRNVRRTMSTWVIHHEHDQHYRPAGSGWAQVSN